MRDYRTTGRKAYGISPYHQRLHETAVARAKLMREMIDAGLSYYEVGRRFCTSETAVRQALKRQGLK